MNVTTPLLGTTYQGVLGAVINSLRTSDEKQITQAEIANNLGITVSTWSRIERGESALTLEQLITVAMFFEMPLSRLFQNIEEQIESLRKQGINVAISKEALIENNALQLSNSQLISMGLLALTPMGGIGIAAYKIYLSLLKQNSKKK